MSSQVKVIRLDTPLIVTSRYPEPPGMSSSEELMVSSIWPLRASAEFR